MNTAVVSLVAVQVDSLSSQVHKLEASLRDKPRLESTLANVERAKGDAEERLKRAVKENEAIQHEVGKRAGHGRAGQVRW